MGDGKNLFGTCPNYNQGKVPTSRHSIRPASPVTANLSNVTWQSFVETMLSKIGIIHWDC